MDSFSDFVANNGILAAAAGITIGFATATFVKSLVSDIIIPVIFLVIVSISKNTGGFVSKFLNSKELRFTNFVSELITWVLIVVAAYLVIDAIRRNIKSKAMTQVQAPAAVMGVHMVGPAPVVQTQPASVPTQVQVPNVQVPPSVLKEAFDEPMSNHDDKEYASF